MKTILITESQYNLMRRMTGRVRKGDVALREDNGSKVNAYLPSAAGVDQALTQAKTIFSKNSTVDKVSTEAGNIDNSSDMSTGEGTKIQIPVNASGQQISAVKNMVSNPSNDNVGVEITKPFSPTSSSGSSSSVSESAERLRRSMPEFSKRDFDRMLESLSYQD